MKKIIFLAILSFFFISISNNAKAKGIPIPVSFGGLTFDTMLDLPNEEDFTDDSGNYVNIGCAYKQISIAWIPMWNWDEEYCLTIEGNKDECYIVSKEKIEEYFGEYLAANNIKLPNAKPSFWNRIGGKIIWLAVIALIIYGAIPSKKEEDAE